MKTVKVTPDNIISVIDVNFDDFRDLQKAVGGHFEIVSTKTLYETFKMPMILLVDEAPSDAEALKIFLKMNFSYLEE